ncbi:sentrin-specific protease 8-like [Haliotis cracherodii]|uniref:sentrin-specific protease 8-like n=1 Tax=Haliotis cracherodii TaxID=6455 RepID=UPI0039E941BF
MAEDEDAIVLSFNDSLIRQGDLRLLEDPGWLNDKLIGFCFEYFEREQFNHSADRLCFISPSFTQLLKLSPVEELVVLLEPLGLPTKQFVFLAVNNNNSCDQVGGSHWSLLVYVRSSQEFRHYDSAGHSNEAIAKKLAYRLQPHVHAPYGRMKFVEMDCPQQQNGYDCGMYVISVSEHLCKEFCEFAGIPLADAVTVNSISNKRTSIKDLILTLAKEPGS